MYSVHEYMCVCIVYMSAGNNAVDCAIIPYCLKLYNEKFRGATDIAVLDQFETNTCQRCNIIKYDTPVRQTLNHEDV